MCGFGACRPACQVLLSPVCRRPAWVAQPCLLWQLVASCGPWHFADLLLPHTSC